MLYSEKMQEKQLNLFRGPNWAKLWNLVADADIYMDKK